MYQLRLFPALLLAAPLLLSACDSVTDNDPEPVRRAFVTRVTIDTFPFVDPVSGEGWDSDNPANTSEADLYIRLLGSNDLELINSDDGGVNQDLVNSGDGVLENQGPGDVPVIFTIANYEIDVLERVLVLQLKDNDSPLNEDDDLGRSESFRLIDFAPPTTTGSNDTEAIPFVSSDNTLTGRITVRWSD